MGQGLREQARISKGMAAEGVVGPGHAVLRKVSPVRGW
jgi:hypothetical protein